MFAGMSSPSPELARFRPSEHRDYSLFLASRLFSTLAVMVEAVTLGWQVYQVARLTKTVEESAFLVGMVGLAQFVPLFALTLIAGAAADHFDRKKISLICVGTELVLVAGLAFLSIQSAPSLISIFAIAAGFGAIRAFQSPAQSSMGPMMVPERVLPSAIAWSSLTWQTGAIFGPWLGGVLCGLSASAAYGGAAVLYLFSAGALFLIRTHSRPEPNPGSKLDMVREGIAYVAKNQMVLGAISLDLFAVLLGGATALLPVYARDILHVGPGGFGLLRAAPALGAACSAFVLGRRPLERRVGVWMFGAVGLFGFATAVFAVSTLMALSMVSLAVLGAADMISVFVRHSLVQVTTPSAMRGRVAAVSSVFIGASNELGEFESGVAARLLGPVAATLLGGVGAMVVTGVWAKLFPVLRKANSLSGPFDTDD